MNQCNHGQQGYTACGVDQLLVVCTFNPEEGSKCLHDFGPCHVGLAQGGSIGECQGRSQYAVHLPSEKTTRPTVHYRNLRAALSLSIEALCTMAKSEYDGTDRRHNLFLHTLKHVRDLVGEDLRLTSMRVVCAWCDEPQGDKEGNGATGETSTICPACFKAQTAAHVPPEVRRVAEAIGAAIGDVQTDAMARKEAIDAIYQGLERGKLAEVAASASLYGGATLEG